MSTVHNGKCFCGSVEFELSGDPEFMGYCHCASCREWSGDPIHAVTIWRADTVKVTAGSEYVATFQKTPESLSHRQFCTQCGGHLMISHPVLGVYDVLPGVVPSVNFVPSLHINYAQAVLPINDDLPKYKDFPSEFSEFGGTGELMS